MARSGMIPARQGSEKRYKSRSIVALLLTAAALGIAGTLLSHPEPAYRGRGLSSWLRDLESGEIETQAEAGAAIKRMGPKATPFVARALRESHAWHQQKSLRERLQSWANWLSLHSGIRIPVPNHHDRRQEALGALDALGEDAAGALPALQALMKESPPDPEALYVIARTGEAGLPIVKNALTSEEKILRMEAQVCLELVQTHSDLLFGEVGSGSDAATFHRRICLFNGEVMQLAARQYREQTAQ
jgi:hypothetical protein